MGQQQSINLLKSSNGCDLPLIVKNVNGLKSNSASPSDIWIIDAHDNVYYEGQNVKKIFMKYFIDPDALIINAGQYVDGNQTTIIEAVTGLLYELYVYRDIIRPLIDNNICDNFVKFLGAGTVCDYSSLANSLNILNKDEKLQRNITYMANLIPKRPSINSSILQYPIPRSDYFDVDAKDLKYMFILNEVIKPGTITLYEYLHKNSYIFPLDYMFQFVFACYSMFLAGLAHNDLHAGNVYVEQRDSPEVVTYVFGDNDESVTFETKIKIKIFDFDRSYSKGLGDNPFLTNLCGMSGACNKVVKIKDLWKIFHGIYIKNPSERMFILNLFQFSDKTQKISEKITSYINGSRFKLYGTSREGY